MVYLTGKGSSLTICERKERVIRLVVVAAEGLPKTDFITGMADPYVKIHLTSVQAQGGGAADLPVVHSFRTATVRCSLTPEWNESFILTPYNLEDRLDLEVWDYDVVGEDDIMGSISCHIGDIHHHCDGMERWYTLRDQDMQPAGKICLRFEVSEPLETKLEAQGGNPPGAKAQLFRKMSFQASARMRRPRLKDLPECLVPDPSLIRSIFQRCFNSKLTVPQIRFFFQLWERFESEVNHQVLDQTAQGSSVQRQKHFALVREMVWGAVRNVDVKLPHGQIGLPEVYKDSNGHPDMDKTPRIWLAIEGAFKYKKSVPNNPKNEQLHRMALFKAKASASFVQDNKITTATIYQRNRPVAGASLFLAPGALSNLMRGDEQMRPPTRSQSLKVLLVKQRPTSGMRLRRQKTAHFASEATLENVRQIARLDDHDSHTDADALEAGWRDIIVGEGGHGREKLAIEEQLEQQFSRQSSGLATPRDILDFGARLKAADASGVVGINEQARERHLLHLDREEITGGSANGSAMRPGSGRPGSGAFRAGSGVRPASGKSLSRGILKKDSAVREVRFNKYMKSQQSQRNLILRQEDLAALLALKQDHLEVP
jgi:hypothetical protein